MAGGSLSLAYSDVWDSLGYRVSSCLKNTWHGGENEKEEKQQPRWSTERKIICGLSTPIQGRLIHFMSISTCPCHSSLDLVFQSLFSKQAKDINFPSIFLEASCCMISGKVRDGVFSPGRWEWADSDLLLDRHMDSAGPSTHSLQRLGMCFPPSAGFLS